MHLVLEQSCMAVLAHVISRDRAIYYIASALSSSLRTYVCPVIKGVTLQLELHCACPDGRLTVLYYRLLG